MHDFEKSVVASSLCCAAEVLKSVKKCNQPILENGASHLGKLSDICLSILRGDAMCQQSFDSDDEEDDDDDEDVEYGGKNNENNRARHHNTNGNLENEDEEEAESSLVLLEAIAEALPALANVVGAQPFASQFEPHFQAILKECIRLEAVQNALQFTVYSQTSSNQSNRTRRRARGIVTNVVGGNTIDGFAGSDEECRLPRRSSRGNYQTKGQI